LDGADTDTALDGVLAPSGAEAGASTITLDREVTLDAETSYALRVRHLDDSMETYSVVSVDAETTTDILSVQAGWTQLPAQYANYSFGEVNRVFKEMRVMRISRSQELRRKLTCLEYVAEVFDDDAEPRIRRRGVRRRRGGS
jgi:predicted phage tail protein